MTNKIRNQGRTKEEIKKKKRKERNEIKSYQKIK